MRMPGGQVPVRLEGMFGDIPGYVRYMYQLSEMYPKSEIRWAVWAGV